MPVRVLLVDDEPIFLEALRALLDGDERVEIVGATESGAAALDLARTTHPDVALGARDPPHAAVEAGLVEDRLRELGPRALAGRGEMPDAVRQLDERANRLRQVPDVGRAAALVVDDRDLVTLRAEPQHRAHEVRARPAEEPGCP